MALLLQDKKQEIRSFFRQKSILMGNMNIEIWMMHYEEGRINDQFIKIKIGYEKKIIDFWCFVISDLIFDKSFRVLSQAQRVC